MNLTPQGVVDTRGTWKDEGDGKFTAHLGEKNEWEWRGAVRGGTLVVEAFLDGKLFSTNTFSRRPAATPAKAIASTVELFNGRDLTGWDGDPKYWKVENGAIVGLVAAGQTLARNTNLVWKDGDVADFELRGEFWIEGGNSGIQYRSRETGRHTMAGYQFDLDSAHKFTGAVYEELGPRQIMARVGDSVTFDASGQKSVTPLSDAAAAIQAIRPQWNEFAITARGNRLTQSINGTVVADVTDGETKAAAASGQIGLQLHSGGLMTVRFRNLRSLRE